MTEGSRFFSWFRDDKDQKTVPPKHPETKPLQASEDITDKEKGPSTETRETSGKYDHPFLNNGSNSDILVAYRKQIEDIDIHLTSHELNKNQREGLRFDRQILGRRIQYLELIDKQMRVFEEEVQEDKRPNYFNHQPDWLEFYGGYEKGIEEKELKSFQQNKRKRNNERRSLNGFDWDSRIKEPKEIIKKIEEHLNLSTDPSFIPGFPKHLKNKLRSYHPAYGTRATFVSDKIVFFNSQYNYNIDSDHRPYGQYSFLFDTRKNEILGAQKDNDANYTYIPLVVNAHPFKKTFIVKDILDNRAPLLIKLDENNNIQPICSMDALVNNIETSSTYYTSSFSYDGAFLEVSTYEKKGF